MAATSLISEAVPPQLAWRKNLDASIWAAVLRGEVTGGVVLLPVPVPVLGLLGSGTAEGLLLPPPPQAVSNAEVAEVAKMAKEASLFKIGSTILASVMPITPEMLENSSLFCF